MTYSDGNGKAGAEKNLFFLAFTEAGFALAERLAAAAGGCAFRSRESGGVQAWTAAHFSRADALVFVGAAGIAVRAIAPFVKSKAADPAVVVIDEGGQFVIPILSGHLGGANKLARRLAAVCGGTPVLTTATDVNGRFAVDEWAKRQNCAVRNPGRIQRVSSGILAGETMTIQSRWPVRGEAPAFVRPVYGCRPSAGLQGEADGQQAEGEPCHPDVLVDIFQTPGTDPEPLRLIPRIAVLGIGCRKGTEEAQIENCWRQFQAEYRIAEEAVCLVTSIDLKKEEAGLTGFCETHGLPFVTFTAEELRKADGDFSSSAFVESVTGVDNVCERSAVCGTAAPAGQAGGGRLWIPKKKYDGVTMALAVRAYHPDWNW